MLHEQPSHTGVGSTVFLSCWASGHPGQPGKREGCPAGIVASGVPPAPRLPGVQGGHARLTAWQLIPPWSSPPLAPSPSGRKLLAEAEAR